MIRAIVAFEKSRGIGFQGKLPWGRSLPGDLTRFKALTLGQKVLVGQRTFAKMPALSGRCVVPISRPSQILDHCTSRRDVWIAGGGTVYRWAMQMALIDEWQITRVDQAFECDTFLVPFEREYRITTRVPGNDPGTSWEVWTR